MSQRALKPFVDYLLSAGWAGASGRDGRGRALQVAARPPIPSAPFPAVTRDLSSGAPGHGRMDAAGPHPAAAPLPWCAA